MDSQLIKYFTQKALRDYFLAQNTIFPPKRPLRDAFLAQNTILSAPKAPAGRPSVNVKAKNPTTHRRVKILMGESLPSPYPPAPWAPSPPDLGPNSSLRKLWIRWIVQSRSDTRASALSSNCYGFNDSVATYYDHYYHYSSTLRAPADPFARTAVSSQRSLLAAQFSRSAVSVLPSKPGRAQGWAKGPMQKAQGQRAQGTKGPFGPFGPRGPSGPWAPSGPRGAAYTQEMLSLTE